MATFTAVRAGKGFPKAGVGNGGSLKVAYGTLEITAAPADGDIYEMCRVPAGATIVATHFYGDDLDTGTEALDMDLGWAANGGSGTYDSADPDGLGNLGTLTGDPFAAGNVANVAGLNYPQQGHFNNGDLPTFTRETVIQLECNTAAGTFAAGAVTVVVFYAMD